MTILLPQLLSALGKTYASLRANGVWESEISTTLAVVSFFKQPGVLQIQKISTSLLSSRQNTSLILLSGKPSAAAPNTFLVFYSSSQRSSSRKLYVTIHRGNSCIWTSPWCNVRDNIHDHLNLPMTTNLLPQTIADLSVGVM
jgi:hypothetical protein